MKRMKNLIPRIPKHLKLEFNIDYNGLKNDIYSCSKCTIYGNCNYHIIQEQSLYIKWNDIINEQKKCIIC